MTCPIMHCFADASQIAYGAIVFIIQYNEVSFVAAKTCVAPFKTMNISWFELMAAVVTTRLTNFIITLSDPSVFM